MKLDRAEALRYLGIQGQVDPALASQVEARAQGLEGALLPRYVYRVCSPCPFRGRRPILPPCS